MKTYQVTRRINATPDKVWAVLTDAKALANGDFAITRIEGAISDGARIRLWSEAAPGRAFALRVSLPEPGRRMIWQGGMPFGLFKGVRTFTLTPAPTGTEFQMQEVFSGLFSGPITRAIPDLTPYFETFATALAHHAERKTA